MPTVEREDRNVRRPGGGLWKDEKRSPGYLPQGRRAPLALLALVALWLLSRLFLHDLGRTLLAAFVILIGLSAFWVAWRMNSQRLAEERYTRGPGWILGLLISKTSVPVARGIHVLMGIGICALGVVVLIR
jgi:hypothetical protein